MSKSRYTLQPGLAHVITTGEPVYITNIVDDRAEIFRPVVTQQGIVHSPETVPLEQLETPYAQVKRKFEFDEFVQELQQKFNDKRYALAPAAQKALVQPKQQRLFEGIE